MDICHICCKSMQASNSFYPRTVRDWSALLPTTRAKPTVGVFKHALPTAHYLVAQSSFKPPMCYTCYQVLCHNLQIQIQDLSCIALHKQEEGVFY